MKYLDRITLLSFLISVYALFIGLKNLDENREQNESQQELLNYLEKHLKSQDEHLASQDRVLENITK